MNLSFDPSLFRRGCAIAATALLVMVTGCSDTPPASAPARTTSPQPAIPEAAPLAPMDESPPLRTIEDEPTVARLPPRTAAPEHLEPPTRLKLPTPDATPIPEPTPEPETPVAAAPEVSPRYLIIHADDAGMCHSVNLGTMDVLKAGAVTSASIMVPCPGFEEFARFARDNPEYDYGIHLTLNAEFRYRRWGPVLPADEVPSLVDPEGYLWRTGEQTAGNARADDVERELRAQIDRALEFGVPLSHLDSHMGTLFRRPDFLDIYLQLGIDYNLPVLLTRGNDFLQQLEINREMIPQMHNAVRVFEQEGFPAVDAVRMYYRESSNSTKRRAYLDMVRRTPPGVTEIVVHCSRNGRDIRAVTRHYRIRTGDHEVFIDKEVVDEIRQSGVQLIDWKQLRQLTAGTSTHHAN